MVFPSGQGGGEYFPEDLQETTRVGETIGNLERSLSVATEQPDAQQTASRSRQKRGPLSLISALVSLLFVLPLAFLPSTWACRIARLMAIPAWAVAGRRRRITLSNLRHVYGHRWSEARIHEVALESWKRIAVSAVEALQIGRWIQDPTFQDELVWTGPWQQLERRQQQGEAFLLVSGHQGPFEVILPILVARGWSIGLLSRPVKNGYIDSWLGWLRRGTVPHILDPTGALPAMGKALDDGISLALLIDQNNRDGLFVPFLGRKAGTTSSVGVLTRRYKVPVVYLQARRIVEGKRYRMHCEIADLPWGDGIRSHVEEVTAAATARIEAMVRENPADWLWMHQRWKVRPDGQREILI